MSNDLDNRKWVIDRLKSVKREGMDDLIAYMDDVGFFSAPASGGNHMCCEYGLVQHTKNVMMAAENIAYALLGKQYMDIRDSVIVVSALHDLGKVGDYDKPLYVPNILKSGARSDAKPYERNKELMNIPHAFKSVIIANRFIDFTEDEEFAIMYHDGLYDRETGGYAVIPGHETVLLLVLHWADMWASHIVEEKSRNRVQLVPSMKGKKGE